MIKIAIIGNNERVKRTLIEFLKQHNVLKEDVIFVESLDKCEKDESQLIINVNDLQILDGKIFNNIIEKLSKEFCNMQNISLEKRFKSQVNDYNYENKKAKIKANNNIVKQKIKRYRGSKNVI